MPECRELCLLADDISRIAAEMRSLGERMRAYAGEIAEHGEEMCGAACIAESWAEGIRTLD